MSQKKIIVYGYGDVRPKLGFARREDFEKYIKEDIFRINKGRHRYTQGKEADVLVLSRKGQLYGHFEVEGRPVAPNEKDRQDYPPVKYVYLVRKSALYGTRIPLSRLGIRGIQFGKLISERQFEEIKKMAAPISEYPEGEFEPEGQGRAAEEAAAERGARLVREAKAGQAQLAAGWTKAMEEMGIRGEPIGAEKLREMIAACGIRPEDNEFSRGIIEMREE